MNRRCQKAEAAARSAVEMVEKAEDDGEIRIAGGSLGRAILAWSASDARKNLAAFKDALTASGETKREYMGEFSFGFPEFGEDGEEYTRNINVPWTTIKEIMAAIKNRARTTQQQGSNQWPQLDQTTRRLRR
ncbi:MAG: hypothetical protein JKY67_00400 [Pseudomonadales bacterium]|nr:hypothetical protein [Pseudomonadales bacterium]